MAVAAELLVLFKGDTSELEGASDKAQSLVSGMAGKLKGIGAAAAVGATAGTAAIAKLGVASIDAAQDFQAGMQEVASLGADLSSIGGIDQLSKDVSGLAAEMGLDAVDATKALYDALSAGQEPAQVLDFLRASANAAVGGVTDLSSAGSALSVAMNSWGESAGSAENVADVMFATVKQGVTTFGELASSIGGVSGIAAAAGVPLETTAAAIAQITTKGKTTSVAVTQLKAIMAELMKPSKGLQEAIAGIGYESGTAAIEALGFEGVLGELASLADETGKPLNTMFSSVEAGAGALDLVAAGGEEFAAKLESIGQAQGSVAGAVDQINASWNRQVELLKSQLIGALREVGLTILPMLIEGMKVLRPAIGAATDVLSALLGSVAGGIDRLSGLASQAGSLSSIFDRVAGAWQAFQSGFQDAQWDAMDPLTSALVGIGDALSSLGFDRVGSALGDIAGDLSRTFESMGAGLAAGAGIIVDAVLALDWDGLRQTVADVVGSIAEGWSGVTQKLSEVDWQTIFGAIGQAVGSVLPIVMAAAQAIGEGLRVVVPIVASVVGAVVQLAGALLERLAPAIASVTGWLADHKTLVTAVGAVIAILAGGPVTLLIGALALIGVAVKALADPIASLGDWFSGLGERNAEMGAALAADWDETRAKAIEAWDSVRSGISDAWDGILDSVSSAGDSLRSMVSDTQESIRSTIASVQDAIRAKVLEIWNAIPEDIRRDLVLIYQIVTQRLEEKRRFIADTLAQIRDNVRERWQEIVDTVREKLTEIAGIVTAKFTEARDSVAAIVDELRSLASEKMDQLRAAIEERLTPLIEMVRTKFAEARDAVSAALTLIVTTAREKWDEVKAVISDRLSAAKSIVEDKSRAIADALLSPLRGAIAEAKKIGQSIIDGLAGAIRSGKDIVMQAILDVVRGLIGWALDALDARSPSRVFEEIGQWIVAGLASGIKNADKKALAEIEHVVDMVAKIAADAVSIISSFAQIDVPRDVDAMVGKLNQLMGMLNRLGHTMADWAKAARDSTNQRWKWGDLLDREELRNVKELLPALASLSQVISAATDAFGKLAEFTDPGDAKIELMRRRLIDLALMADQLVTEYIHAPFIAGVGDIADAVKALADGLASVAALDLSEASAIAADELATARDNLDRLWVAVQQMSTSFRAQAVADQEELVAGVRRYADQMSAALGLMQSAADASSGWDDVTRISHAALVAAQQNAADIMSRVEAMSASFRDLAEEAQVELTDAVGRYSEAVRAALSLFEAARDASEEWPEVGRIASEALNAAEQNAADIWSRVQRISETFRSLAEETQVALTDGVTRYVDGAKAALELLSAAARIDADWSKATAIDAAALSVVADNVQAMLADVQRIGATFVAGGMTEEGNEQQKLITDSLKRYIDMAKGAVELLSAGAGVTVDWSKMAAVSKDALSIVADNVDLMLREVGRIAALWVASGLTEDDGEVQQLITESQKRYVDMARGAVDLLVTGADVTVDWSSVTAVTAEQLRVVGDNVELMLAEVESIASTFLAHSEGDQQALSEGLSRYIEMAQSSVDLLVSAAGVNVRWKRVAAIAAADLATVRANLLVMVAEVVGIALDLSAKGYDEATLETLKSVADLAVAPVKALSEAASAMASLSATRLSPEQLEAGLDAAIEGVRAVLDAITDPAGPLAGIDAEIAEAQAELAGFAGSAAEAMGKVQSFLADMMANPFMIDPQQSGFAKRMDRTYLDGLKASLIQALRDAIEVVTEVMNDQTILDSLANVDTELLGRLDVLAEVYGKLADVIVKINGLDISQRSTAAFLDAVREIYAGLPVLPAGRGPKTTGSGGGSTTNSVVEGPGGVTTTEQHYHQHGDIVIVADEGDFPGLISSLAGWATP